MNRIKLSLALALCLLFLFSCKGPEKAQGPTLEKVSAGDLPSFHDDMDLQSLQAAVAQSLSFFSRVPADRSYNLGGKSIEAKNIQASLLTFQKLLKTGKLNKDTIAQNFDVFRIRPAVPGSHLLVTGYYEAILQGRLTPSRKFHYPLYSLPPDLLQIDLSAFDPQRYAGVHLVGRLVGNRVVPYFTRKQIDGGHKLKHCGCQMLWLKNPVAAFFLQVQGSGLIQLADGRYVRVGYAGSNGRPYRSIGKYLLDKGVISRQAMSMQTIRAYLATHPEVRNKVLWYNKNYVFFRWVNQGPVGSLNVPLTAGRSIATDPHYYPCGGLAFLQSEQPQLNARNQVDGWKPLQRWVLNQDTGAAIKGPERVDLFCGSGKTAGAMAGRLKNLGALYFLVGKNVGLN